MTAANRCVDANELHSRTSQNHWLTSQHRPAVASDHGLTRSATFS